MSSVTLKSALVSVFNKDGLEPILREMHALGVKLYSTGGTQKYIESLNIPVEAVEDLTSYPSILDGRVKTLHPKIFGGLLARREAAHLAQLEKYNIPQLDAVIVDLYPFEETVAASNDEAEIIEKIDIGGISLIRAAAKNYQDVIVVASKNEYTRFLSILQEQQGTTTLADRKELARLAFKVTSHYDTAIYSYFDRDSEDESFKQSIHRAMPLRYGENPHQSAVFFGEFEKMFEKKSDKGKEISYNNFLDIDAAVGLMNEFLEDDPTFAILKHNNACGLATRPTVFQAWKDALACDPTSAFGGILITNTKINLNTAEEINQLFYEVVIAPAYTEEALKLLTAKKGRIVLVIKEWHTRKTTFRSLLNGVIQQETDLKTETAADLKLVTKKAPTETEISDLLFASKCTKHLKSNSIALIRNKQLIGMGCGQTSRIDSLKHAIEKAQGFGFDLTGTVMSSEAFFPFPDCVEIAHKVGVTAVLQPGGSIKDKDSIAYCDANDLAMVMTGFRHFKH
jgi:phosphoribosylaminoimidazolecarboxamide formyltransferase / IMP cyclohydrolase